jgi:hypothetical protein
VAPVTPIKPSTIPAPLALSPRPVLVTGWSIH